MKRFIGFLIVLVFALPLPADTVPSTVTWGSPTALTKATNGVSDVVPAANYRKCFAQITSASSSTTNVLIEGSSDSSFAKVQTLGTITNPTNNGEYWGGACPAFMRFEVSSYVSGTITVVYERRELITN